jgi:hypothetical protein
VIGRVHPRGTRIGGLIRYLYGPGKHEEHTNPRLVAAWQGSGDLHTLEPITAPNGRRDFRALVALLEDPLLAANHVPAKPVWHLSLRLAPQDRILSDEQWGHIAAEVMALTGLARHDDPDAIRWIAVRHGPDHIHIAATLVRQDGRTETAFRDYLRTRAAAQDIERRYGLRQTAPADRTAVRRPTSNESRQATRQRRAEAPRDRLRREVRHAAAAADTENEFFDRLQQAGVIVKLRHSQQDNNQITGYAVALPDATTASGDPIFYSGGKLAADLTLPKLRHRWHSPSATTRTAAATQGQSYAYAGEQIRTATQKMKAGSLADDGEADAAAMAAADVLTVTARKFEGRRRGPLNRAAEALDRAARLPHGRSARATGDSQQLRSVSRLIAAMGTPVGDPTLHTVMKLLVDLGRLADTLAILRQSQHRLHQARAAGQAAAVLRTITSPTGSSRTTAGPDLRRSTVPIPRPSRHR